MAGKVGRGGGEATMADSPPHELFCNVENERPALTPEGWCLSPPKAGKDFLGREYPRASDRLITRKYTDNPPTRLHKSAL